MKTTAHPDAEQGQKAGAGQIHSQPARQQTIKPSGHLAQLVAMANAGPQTETLAQIKDMAQQSPRVQNLMSLTNGMGPGSPAQLSGILVGQEVVQRELYKRGGFIEPEPEVTEDYETLMQHDTWEFLQQGMEMFTSAAGDILGEIEKLPNLVLTLSTSTEIGSIGKTTLKLTDPTGKVRTSEAGKDSSATVNEWSRWLGDPATRVGIVVQVNPNKVGNAAVVAHTLNHEVFLHAVEIFHEIKHLKSIKNDKERETFAVKHIRNPDKDHADFVFGRKEGLIINQSRMISNAMRDNPVRARQLAADYQTDWSDRREEMLKGLAGNLKYENEKELETIAIGNIKALSSIPEAQGEVKVMREMIRIINYSFDAHVADIRDRYRIDLQPRIEEPRRGGPVDIPALPTGPKKKGKQDEKKKGE